MLNHPGHIGDIVQTGRTGVLGPGLLNIKRRAPGSQIDAGAADFTVILSIIAPAVERDRGGRPANQLQREFGGGSDNTRVVIHFGARLFEKLSGFVEVDFKTDFRQHAQRGFMNELNVFVV